MQILQGIGSCMHQISTSNGVAASLFLAGVMSGFTHCVAMCGPFVISQSGKMEKTSDMLLFPYHFGRITTYVCLAVLLSTVLNIVFLYLPIRSFIIAPILMVAGLVFLSQAFPRLVKFFPWVSSIKLSFPYLWVQKIFGLLSNQPTPLKTFMMGIVLGFMPCAMVTSALLAASTAQNIFDAGFSMFAFGLGTVPALVITSFAGQALKIKYSRAMPYIIQAMMVWSGVWLFIIAGKILI